MTNDAQQGSVLGNYAVTKLGAKKIAIIDDRTAYGQGLADEVEKAAKAAGGEVVAREYTTDRSTDFMAILTSIKGKAPDLVFFGGMDPQAAPMIRQMKQLGMTAEVPRRRRRADAQVHQAGRRRRRRARWRPTLACRSTRCPAAARSRPSSRPSTARSRIYAPYAYDAMHVLIEAMKRADSSDPAKYLAELPKTDYQGVTGHIALRRQGRHHRRRRHPVSGEGRQVADAGNRAERQMSWRNHAPWRAARNDGHLPAATHQRPGAGQRLRAGGAGLHHGVRHPGTDQFRPRRDHHDGRDGGAGGDRRAGAGGARPAGRCWCCWRGWWWRFRCAWRWGC